MTRTVKLTLEANVKGLQAGLRTAQKATQDYARDVESWRKKHEESLDTVGSAAGKFGLTMAAGLAFAGKAAIDWESSWTGVLKTVDGTPEQLGRVEDGLRGLARELPSTHTEIAAVAEAAGQLGIETENVVDFTKVMIDLGESTNMGAEQAAMSLSRFMNIMGTSQTDVSRLGATLVGLGNNFATTESEIMDMSMRLAGAGKQARLSEGQVMGLATAMSSVGIEAEAGGTAMSMILKKIGKAVDEGGEALELFASTSGMSASEFRNAWGDDASGTLSKFVTGLGKAAEGGESVNSVLGDLGIKGIRESDALLRLSAAGELVGDSMRQGAEEYASGMALIEEANKRYQTAESKIAIAWNNIKDAAISAGSVILPVIADLADGIADLAAWFADLPEPVQAVLTLLAGVGAAAGLAVGGIVPLARKFSDLREAIESVYGSGGRATRSINNIGKALGAITVVGAGLIIGKATIEGINKAAREGYTDVEEYFNLIATGGDVVGATDLSSGDGWLGSLADSKERVKDFYGTITVEAGNAKRAIESIPTSSGLTGWFRENLSFGDVRKATEDLLQMQEAMRGIARAFDMGEVELGIGSLKDFATQLELTDADVGALLNSVPELKSALTQLATAEGIQIDPNDELGLVDLALGRVKLSADGAADGLGGAEDALTGVGDEAGEAAAKLEDILDVMFDLGLITRNVIQAEDALTSSLRDLDKAVAENGKKFTGNSEAAMSNRAALIDVASSMEDVVEAQAHQGASASEMQATMRTTYDAMMKATGGSEELVRSLLSIPPEVDVDTYLSDQALKIAEATAAGIEAIPGYKPVTVAVTEDGTTGTVQSQIDAITGKTEFVFVDDEGTSRTVQQRIIDIDGVERTVWVDDKGTVIGTQSDINGIKGKDVKVSAIAETGTAEWKLQQLTRNRSVSIYASVLGGQFGGAIGAALNGRAKGGRLPGLDSGGRLPATGLGTDKILGVNPEGVPLAWVDDKEWVVNRKSSDKFNATLAAINADSPSVQHLAGYQGGGQLMVPPPRYPMPISTNGRGQSVIIHGPLVQVEQMAVREEADIGRVSQSLFKRVAAAGRANGVVLLGGPTQ